MTSVHHTIPVCAFCGQDTGELGSLNAMSNGETPLRLVLNYKPCEPCQATMRKGVACFEVDDPQTLNRPPLQSEGALSAVAPTGAWTVLRDEQLDKLPIEEAYKAEILKSRRLILDTALFRAWFADVIKEKADGQKADAVYSDAAPAADSNEE
jgi:hypothetical protein